jgi:hypothetical protein|tara:strand:- start:329 stop:517 length:189 start_codon:yes stop_codon:yes gene_type:complete
VDEQDMGLRFAVSFINLIGARSAVIVSFAVLVTKPELDYYFFTGHRLVAALSFVSMPLSSPR